MPTRAVRLAQILELRARGLTNRQVAARLGMTKSGVQNVLTDPDGSKQKARRLRYQGACEICGAPTDGSNGRAKTPRHCRECAPTAALVWTADLVIERIRLFARERGRPPTAMDWNPHQARALGHPEVADAFDADPRWPYFVTVQGRFGSWANGIEAAGFPRPRNGYYQDESRRGRRREEALR